MIRRKGGQNPFSGRKLGPRFPNCPNSISCEPLAIESWLTSQNNSKNWFTMSVPNNVCPLDNRKCPKMTFYLVFFLVLYDKTLKVSITQELYIKLNWPPFKMTKRTIFLLVFNTIYISRTKGSVIKWVFQDFFWMRIYQDFFQNIRDYNIHGNQKESRKNQLFHCRN